MRQFVAKDCPGSLEEWDWRKTGERFLSRTSAQNEAPKETQEEVDKEKQRKREEEHELQESTKRLRAIFA